jgi:hypothetical protein
MRNHTAKSVKTIKSATTSKFPRSLARPSRQTRSSLLITVAGIAGLLGVANANAPATAAEPNGLPQAYSAKIVDTSSLSLGTVAPVVSMLPVPTTKPDSNAVAAPVVVKKKKAKKVTSTSTTTTTEPPTLDREALVLALPASKNKSSKASEASDETKDNSQNSSLDAAFAALRKCESGGNYKTATGNGYYGAYQFDPRTWRSLGYSGLPSDAAPEVQDEAARRLLAKAGWGQWPACSRKLGLR